VLGASDLSVIDMPGWQCKIYCRCLLRAILVNQRVLDPWVNIEHKEMLDDLLFHAYKSPDSKAFDALSALNERDVVTLGDLLEMVCCNVLIGAAFIIEWHSRLWEGNQSWKNGARCIDK
jgi:hypothetical protein